MSDLGISEEDMAKAAWEMGEQDCTDRQNPYVGPKSFMNRTPTNTMPSSDMPYRVLQRDTKLPGPENMDVETTSYQLLPST